MAHVLAPASLNLHLLASGRDLRFLTVEFEAGEQSFCHEYTYMSTYICVYIYMGGCQNYGPFLGPLNTRCRIILMTQQWTIILTATHIHT